MMIEAFSALQKLFDSYPLASKIGLAICVLCFFAIAFFSPRTSAGPSPQESTEFDPDKPVFLEIGEVRLFPGDSAARVKVRALVNNTEFVHPSIGGVEWMQVGPQMSHKIMELPRAVEYNVRFELIRLNQTNLTGNDRVIEPLNFMSQQVVDIVWFPYSDVYALYEVDALNTRAANVSAEIDFRVFQR